MDDALTRRELVGAGAAGAALLALRATPAPAAARRRTRRADVCVVGAGLSGLAAARALVAAGRTVVVLEARDRVGGRTLNRSIGGGHISEIGGQFAGPTQDRILALARAVDVKTFRTYDTGSNVLIEGGVRSLYPAVPGLPEDPDVQQAILAAAKLDAPAKQAGVIAPWKSARAHEWDRMSLDDWMRSEVPSDKGRAIFTSACQSIWGADPKDLSLLYVLQYSAAAGNAAHPGSFLRLITTGGGGAQESRFVGGSQLISEKAADRLGKRVVLEAPVKVVAQNGDGVRIVAGGVTVEARRAILAVPPALATRLAYSPALPKGKAKLLAALVPGSLTKATAVFDRPFWRDAGLSGQGVADVGPARTIFDNSPPDGSVGVLFGFVGGSAYAPWGPLPADQRRAQVLESFAAFVGDQARAPVDYFEQDWTKERWTRGCPVAHVAPGVLTKYGPWLRRSVGKLHFAGTETADYWLGYMDGAVRSGERAAREVLAALRR